MTASIHRTVLFLLVSAFASLLVAGCGTVRGFGEDMSKLGQGIKKAAH